MFRTLVLAAALGSWTLPALVQDWAKQKLEKSPRHGEYVDIKNGDRTLHAFVVYPEVSQKATAVIVIHEIFGLTDWAKLAADEFAAAGYIAIAPDMISGAEAGTDARRAISKLPLCRSSRIDRGAELRQISAGGQRQGGRGRLLLGRR